MSGTKFLRQSKYLGTLAESQHSSNIRELSNNDGDVNENGAIGLDWQNNNFEGAPRFFVHFVSVTARLLRRENAKFQVL